MPTSSSRRRIALGVLAVLCIVHIGAALYLRHVSSRSLIAEGDIVPFFAASTLNGVPFDWKTTRAQKMALLFFSPSCEQCRNELAQAERMFDRSEKNVCLIGVSSGTSEATRALAASLNLHFTILLADPQMMSMQLGIKIVPTIFVVDEERILRGRYRDTELAGIGR